MPSALRRFRELAAPFAVPVIFTAALASTGCKTNSASAGAPGKPADPAGQKAPAKAADPGTDKASDKPGEARKDDPSLPGIDLAGLDPSQIDGLSRIVDEKPSPCGKSHSLRTSLKTDASCKRAGYAARYLVRLLKAGLLPSEAEEVYDKRFVSPARGECDMKDANIRGSDKAKITLCEFADFQCPHCKMVEPILAALMREYPDDIRVAFKNYPISKLHPESGAAAAAAVAAGMQGKFWQMHDKLFQNQDHLTEADLEKYAGELKLDVKKWKADLAAAKVKVEAEHAEGEKLDIGGTPTLYVNGRQYAGPLRYEEFKDWVDEELGR